MVLGALYGYFTFSEYLTSWYGSVKWDMEVLYRLFDPKDYWWWFFFAAFIGVLLPIMIIAIPRFRNINSITFASLIAVLALWVKRYLIIIPTLEAPLLPKHDLRPEYVHYSATWVEWSLTVSGVALFLLLFYLFSKMIPIIPVVKIKSSEEKDYLRLRKMTRKRMLNRLMKQVSKDKEVAIGIVLVLSSSIFMVAKAQELLKSRLQLDYFNNSGIKTLQAKLTARKDEKTVPLSQMILNFYVVTGKDKKLLGTDTTGEAGEADLVLPSDLGVSRNNEGKYNYLAAFSGTSEYLPSESSKSIRDVFLSISFIQKDSTKLIDLIAKEIRTKGDSVPISGQTIKFYVPRTFSYLKVGEAMITSGIANMEFPTTLPGDELGNLTIVAKFEDNEDYGNAETKASINWGKPLPPLTIVKRGLGDVDAPLWMVYTLIVLLSLVWFHYIYAIISVFRLNGLGKKDIARIEVGKKANLDSNTS
jgi:hypothetical protein